MLVCDHLNSYFCHRAVRYLGTRVCFFCVRGESHGGVRPCQCVRTSTPREPDFCAALQLPESATKPGARRGQ